GRSGAGKIGRCVRFYLKPIDSEKVLSVLQQYLPSSLSVQLRQIKTPPAWSPKYQA
ncbi:MAG: hypothetical protein HC769_15390, partial [Cyanobacteria bacterium CRU_2_1]|nr:hypothetical protein [Cyanobacteria bacterium CRU_2_1]